MKLFLAGFATAAAAAALLVLWQGVRNGEWMIMSIKSPGQIALRDIQADMKGKNYGVAAQKVDVFLRTWEKFSSGPDSRSGTGIRDIIATFSEMRNPDNERRTARCPLSVKLSSRLRRRE